MPTKQLTPILNDDDLSRAIEEFYLLAAPLETSDTEPDAYTLALRDAVAAYQQQVGHTPAPPTTVAGVLEVEMFKRHLRQRAMAQLLEVPETRLSEIIRGKRAMNLDFARRLHERLGVPAEVVLRLRDVA
jgi:HTH-type transcriptional regulator/antitoxin HigA